MIACNLKVIEGDRRASDGFLRDFVPGRHPCEYCKCCSCKKICTKCKVNCSPTDSYFIPVIGCPEFEDMRNFQPVRYLYRTAPDREYRISLPKPK